VILRRAAAAGTFAAVAAVALVAAILAVTAGCKKNRSASSSPGDDSPAPAVTAGPMDAREADAWERAKTGDEPEQARLVDLVGCDGVRARAEDDALRPTALRAMGECPDFSELPWLADLASSGSDAEATLALDAITQQAARRRRPVDPEDASELGEGCRALLGVARSQGQPAPRRARAVTALHMLADRGCVKRADIPSAPPVAPAK
jgi:hypothetical protein